MKLLFFLSSTFLRKEIAYLFIFLSIVFGILYLIKFIYNSFRTIKHSNNVDYLLKNGKKIEIDLTTSVISITEDKRITEFNESATFDNLLKMVLLILKKKGKKRITFLLLN